MRMKELGGTTGLAKRMMVIALITVLGIVLLSHFMSSPKQVTVVVLNRNPQGNQGEGKPPALRIVDVHQPVGVGAADDQEAIEKIVDLPEAVEPSTSAPGSEEVLIDEEDPVIDFPQKLPAGVRVDDKGNVFANNTLLFTKNMVGFLNVEIWIGVEGILVDDLRLDKKFPDSPMNEGKLTSFYNSFGMDFDDYGEKIFGYIVPKQSGLYKFAVASDDASEVWLSSDHQPANLKKISCLGCIDPKDIPPRFPPPAPPVFSANSNFNVHPRQISEPIKLEAYRPYYVEVYHKEATEADYVNVNWQVPGATEMSGIPRNQFAMAKYLPSRKLSATGSGSLPPPLKGPFPSHTMQRPMKVPFVGNDVVESVVLPDVLPTCEYHPSYVSVHEVTRYTGFKEVLATVSYPDDHTWYKNGRHESEGNPIIEEEHVAFVALKFTEALEKKYGSRFDEFRLKFLEENPNVKDGTRNGWRYLIEGNVHWTNGDKPTAVSEYVHRPEDNATDDGPPLCLIKGFQWDRKTHVNIIVTVKNIGRWILHLIRNMEDIYLTTGDERFTIIICDFESTDLNITQALLESRLKPHMYKLISLTGRFRKTLALQAGIDWVSTPVEVVMTLDLHLTLPIGIMQSIRKHTIMGQMGYAPMVFRLGPAFTEHNIQGYWETMGYGLMALTKYDWDRIGGQNVEEFTDKWGGEDWETVDRVQANGIETFRHRYPGLVHYYHSHKGMWNS